MRRPRMQEGAENGRSPELGGRGGDDYLSLADYQFYAERNEETSKYKLVQQPAFVQIYEVLDMRNRGLVKQL